MLDWQRAAEIALASFTPGKMPGTGELKVSPEDVQENDEYYLFESEFTGVFDDSGYPIPGYGRSRIVVDKQTGEVGALSSSIPAHLQLDGLRPITV